MLVVPNAGCNTPTASSILKPLVSTRGFKMLDVIFALIQPVSIRSGALHLKPLPPSNPYRRCAASAAGPFSLSNYQGPIPSLQFFLTLIRTAIQPPYVAIEIWPQRAPSQVNQFRAHDQRRSRETSIAPGPKRDFQGAEHRNTYPCSDSACFLFLKTPPQPALSPHSRPYSPPFSGPHN